MTTKTLSRFKGKVRDTYLELVRVFPLTSVRSERELRAALKVMDEIFSKGTLSSGEELYIDALSDLVAAYEDQHQAIKPATDSGMLRHLLEAKGISQAELHRETGIAKSTISEILAGRKPFSRKIIRTLADYFDVSISVLTHSI